MPRQVSYLDRRVRSETTSTYDAAPAGQLEGVAGRTPTDNWGFAGTLGAPVQPSGADRDGQGRSCATTQSGLPT